MYFLYFTRENRPQNYRYFYYYQNFSLIFLKAYPNFHLTKKFKSAIFSPRELHFFHVCAGIFLFKEKFNILLPFKYKNSNNYGIN